MDIPYPSIQYIENTFRYSTAPQRPVRLGQRGQRGEAQRGQRGRHGPAQRADGQASDPTYPPTPAPHTPTLENKEKKERKVFRSNDLAHSAQTIWPHPLNLLLRMESSEYWVPFG